ncbi:MAG: hypothetical protein ABI702_13035 [Burkholderiales bacterium]
MQTVRLQIKCPPLRQSLAAGLIAALSGGAWAADDPSPYFLGIRQEVAHDSNVYRVPDGRGDYYSSTGLVGGFDQLISRQRVYASANIKYNKYHNEDTLDNTSYGVRAGWDWATIENLSGSFNGNANQNLASFNGNNTIPTSSRNLAKTDQVAASIKWGGEGLITLKGDYGHSRVKYSAPEYLGEQSSGDTGSVGAFFRLGADTRVGAGVRFTHSSAPYALPNGIVTDPTDPSQFHELKSSGRNLDLTVDWRYSAQTNFFGRLSYTRQTFSPDLPELPPFSGLTGAIYGNYAPTAKLSFNVAVIRDAGINSAFFNVVGAPSTGSTASNVGLSENSQVTDVANLGLRYEVTAKIAATAGYQYRHSKTVNVTLGDQSDHLRSTQIGLTYDITRNWQAACNLSHESRSVSSGLAYSANVAGCLAQFTLR